MKSSIFKNLAAAFLLLIFFPLFSEQQIHTVQKGETLYSISRQYGLTVAELRTLNGLSDDSVLKAGQQLKVSQPEKEVEETTQNLSLPSVKNESSSSVSSAAEQKPVYKDYVVQKSDTLYSIAKNNGITVAELRTINGFDDKYILKYGSTIKVPDVSLSEVITVTASTAKTSSSAGTSVTNTEMTMTAEDPRTYVSGKTGNINLEWPVKAKEVTYVAGKISGVTITTDKNEKVVVLKEGTVTFSGFYRGFGNVVFVKSDAGYIYVYSGLDSVSVSIGSSVKHGDTLGVVGVDALSGKYQINLMVYKDSKVIDPASAPRG